MAQYRIQGQAPLGGTIVVEGAKNHALKVISASILSEDPLFIERVPAIEDVKRLLEILQAMGASVKTDWDKGTVRIDSSGVKSGIMPGVMAGKIRASTVLIGPLLARFGRVELSYPGGCLLGRRPIDMFLDAFKTMGATISENDSGLVLETSKLTGGFIFMQQKSVTVTETVMMAATLAEGITTIHNAACEPEITALADYLNTQGARINGAGTHTITIEGVDRLSAGTAHVIADRLEAGTFAIMAAATQSDITVAKCEPAHLSSLWVLFDRIGIPYEIKGDSVRVRGDKRNKCSAVNVKTHEYPGFPTDLQAPFTVLLTQCEGLSLIHETIFEGRLFYTDKLNRMGSNIILCDPHRAIVQGATELRGKHLESPDIRAGIAMIIAGLVAKGETTIDNIYQVERGYANIVERLAALGANISLVE